MTKARHPSTFADAVTRIAGRVGWTAMAEAVGKTERAVRNWSDPDMDRQPGLDDALQLDRIYLEAGGGEAPLLAVYQHLLDRAIQPPADTAELVRATATTAKEVGEAVAALVQAAQPGAGHVDRAVADRELTEAIDALNEAKRKLGAPAAASVTPLRPAS